MGTRNLTCIKKNGNYVLAKYCQWDGYYERQGQMIADFLRKPGNIEKLRERADALRFISDEELNHRWIEAGADPDSSWVSLDVSRKFRRLYPELSRDTGGEILKMICGSNEPVYTINDLNFAADGLFCEFAYVIDFDENTFSWYEGFGKTRLLETERFAFLNSVDSEYYPVHEVGKVPLEPDSMPDWKHEIPNEDD